LKQYERGAEASLEAMDCAVGDTVPGSSLSNIDEVEARHLLIQRVELAPEVTFGVAGAADGIGEALDTAGKVVTFTQDFLGKCQFVSYQLGFIVGAVDEIAEVRSFPSIVFQFCSKRQPFLRFILTQSWRGV